METLKRDGELERNGGASTPELAGGDGEGNSAKCSHNVDDKGRHIRKIMWTVELLGNIGECDREHVGNIEHNFLVRNRSEATKNIEIQHPFFGWYQTLQF